MAYFGSQQLLALCKRCASAKFPLPPAMHSVKRRMGIASLCLHEAESLFLELRIVRCFGEEFNNLPE